MHGQSQQHAIPIAPCVFGVGYLISLFTCVWVCVTLSGEERCLYRLIAANILNYLVSFHAKHRNGNSVDLSSASINHAFIDQWLYWSQRRSTYRRHLKADRYRKPQKHEVIANIYFVLSVYI